MTTMGQRLIVVGVVSSSPGLARQVRAAIADLNFAIRTTAASDWFLGRAAERMRTLGHDRVDVAAAPSAEQLLDQLRRADRVRSCVLVIGQVDELDEDRSDPLAAWDPSDPDSSPMTADSGRLFTVVDPVAGARPHSMRRYAVRRLPAESGRQRAEIIGAVVDAATAAPRRSRVPKPGVNRLAELLRAAMDVIAPDGWDLHYYTGSAVAALIEDLDSHVEARGGSALRGPNEHALAAGALARWQLERRPFLIVITSAMLDEFKGMLANLRQARARGLIISAEGRAGEWFGFQSTRSVDEDMGAVLTARGIPHVLAQDPRRLADDVREAASAVTGEAHDGPAVLRCTPDVLELVVRDPGEASVLARRLRGQAPVRQIVVSPDVLAEVAHVFADPERRLLIRSGAGCEEERGLIGELAIRAGAATVDTLTRPGATGHGPGGKTDPHYLGTLGLYGYSEEVLRYTHGGGRLLTPDRLSMLFHRSRIGEIATPFSHGTMRRRAHVIQVTDRPDHLAPCADIGVVATGREFLRALLDRLDVPEGLVVERRGAIDRARREVSERAPDASAVPPTPPSFFAELGALFGDLIGEGLDYTGVYEVGRCGISAIRSVPRTRAGFSGWYGRAAMGDAIQAVPSLAHTGDRPVVAFVGDGAAQIGPDIVPSMVEHAAHVGHPPRASSTVFQLLDGGHSLIRSYEEGRLGRAGGRQTVLADLIPPENDQTWAGLRVRHRVLRTVDSDAVREAVGEPGALTFFSVPLAHVSSGDGLSLLDPGDWRLS